MSPPLDSPCVEMRAGSMWRRGSGCVTEASSGGSTCDARARQGRRRRWRRVVTWRRWSCPYVSSQSSDGA
eukprot:1031115-Prymnesium_polylepis.1